jgi:hypothetical protein
LIGFAHTSKSIKENLETFCVQIRQLTSRHTAKK